MAMLAQVLPLLRLGLAVGAAAIAVWALAPLRSSAGRAGSNLSTVAVVAVTLGVVAAIGFGGLVGFGCFDSGPESGCRTAFLPAQAVVGALIALASIVGYAVLRRARVGTPLVGTILGPVVLTAVVFGGGLLSLQVSYAAQREQEAQAAAQVETRSAVLHPTVGNVHVTMAPGGVVDGVSLTVSLHVDREIRFDASSKTVYPRFSFLATGGETIEPVEHASSVAGLTPATDSTWDLTFVGGVVAGLPTPRQVASTFASPTEGTWRLAIQIVDDVGAAYEAVVDVVIAGAA